MNDFTTPRPQMVETRVGSEPVTSIEMGERPADGSKTRATSTINRGLTADIDGSGVHLHESDRSGIGADHEDGEAGEAGEVRAEGEGQEGGEGQGETLPDFDANSADTVEEYNAVFLNDAGQPDLAVFAQDWQRLGGKLSDNHYNYLAHLGHDRETVDGIIEGQKALAEKREGDLSARAGGKEAFEAAVKWGAAGGYTQAQKDRFNKAMNSTNLADREDAVDALMKRYRESNPQRRAVNPKRTVADTGGGAPQSAVKPYETHAEWQADIRKARAENNQKLLNEARARIKVSPWYSGRK